MFFFLELYGVVVLQLTYFQLWPKMKKVGRATFLFCVNNCDRISTTFYIPTTNQCLIIFTNHIQILFLNLWLLKLTKNRHYHCCFLLKLDEKTSPPPHIFTKTFQHLYKVSFENLHLAFIKGLWSGGQGRFANYGFIYRNKSPPLHVFFTPSPNFKGTFAIFPQGYFIITPLPSPVY